MDRALGAPRFGARFSLYFILFFSDSSSFHSFPIESNEPATTLLKKRQAST